MSKIENVQTINKSRWSPDEDEALRRIRQNLNYKSWNMISKKMASQFGFFGRTQKQCRDRYQNYIKDKNLVFNWNCEEQAKMFRIFVRQGSRWTLISSYFQNMKGVHLKNKFYTRVRKAIRKINSAIEFHFSKRFTPFTFDIVSKIVCIISGKTDSLKLNSPNNRISQAQNNQYAKILFQLIELTHNDEVELFPQLGLKPYGKDGKKRLYKNLIKKLKQIDQIKSEFKYPIDKDYQINGQGYQMNMRSEQNDDQKQRIIEEVQKKKCGYKIINISQQHTKNHIILICKSQKKESFSLKSFEQKYNQNKEYKVQYKFQKLYIKSVHNMCSKQEKYHQIQQQKIGHFKTDFHEQNYINQNLNYKGHQLCCYTVPLIYQLNTSF